MNIRRPKEVIISAVQCREIESLLVVHEVLYLYSHRNPVPIEVTGLCQNYVKYRRYKKDNVADGSKNNNNYENSDSNCEDKMRERRCPSALNAKNRDFFPSSYLILNCSL